MSACRQERLQPLLPEDWGRHDELRIIRELHA